MGATVGKRGFLDLPSQSCHVVILGLDSAGKTTALYRLKFDSYLNTVPTIGFNCEKVQGTLGKAKGVQFLVWDVGGQEKLRPLWRSYTRCTDGILFVVDSVDVERMEEAKMELMRTAKCPDNQGVPVLIFANKQDLPGACNPKDLEKLLGLCELEQLDFQTTSNKSKLSNISSNSTGNISTSASSGRCLTPTNASSHHSRSFSSNSSLVDERTEFAERKSKCTNESTPSSAEIGAKEKSTSSNPNKGWVIQPTCAITGEGLQEGLEALYEMILKRRKLSKAQRKTRR